MNWSTRREGGDAWIEIVWYQCTWFEFNTVLVFVFCIRLQLVTTQQPFSSFSHLPRLFVFNFFFLLVFFFIDAPSFPWRVLPYPIRYNPRTLNMHTVYYCEKIEQCHVGLVFDIVYASIEWNACRIGILVEIPHEEIKINIRSSLG